MRSIGVIAARGGSVRIPQKNLQAVGGVPLVARAVQAAHGAKRLGRVIVSTDDPRIAAVAESEGAEVIRRPAELCDGDVPVEAPLVHAIETLRAEGERAEAVVLVMATAPFTVPEDIDGTLEALENQGADSAFAAAAIENPACSGRGFCQVRSSAAAWVAEGPMRKHADAGSVYAMRTAGFVEAKSRFFGKTVAYWIEPSSRFVVQTPGDLYRARQIAGEGQIRLDRHPTIYVDIDETICITPPDRDYRNSVPIPENIATINRLVERGHTIVYWTARGGKSGRDWTDLTRSQLDRWGARYHRLLAGKPPYDLLICDKAISRVPQKTR